MNILIIKTAPGEICVDKSTYNHQEIGLARALRKKGHVCDVVCSTDTTEKRIQVDVGLSAPVTLYCLKTTKVLKNCFYHSLDNVIEQYNCLQLSEYNQMYTWHIAKKYQDKMVVYHGPYYCDFNKRYNVMAKVFDALFVNRYRKLNTCFITKSRLSEDYLRKKGLKNVHTVGVGIDIEALTAGKEDTVPFVEDVLKKQKYKKMLLYIGRIEPRRNPMFLIDVIHELVTRNEDIGLILIGVGEADYVETFWKHADEMGVRERIIYQEKLEQKYLCQVYPFADVFLLPTIYDIFGMVLLEAMYFSMPVLTTVNGGSDMLIKNDENGYVFRDFDVRNWCDCIIELCGNAENRKKVGSRAHDTVCNEFTWEVLSESFLNLYSSHIMNGDRV
jgi:glycosyltransferase involved in cell wall biosynthesis